MPIPSLKLNSGFEIPQIGFGTGTKFRGTDVSPLVSAALDAGFTHLDCAQIYRNEDTVGRALVESPAALTVGRSKLFITSKFFTGDINSSCRDSLHKLQLDYIDLYLVHLPSAIGPDPVKGWKVFEGFQRDGLARSIGVSNHNLEQLRSLVEAAEIKPAVNQVRLHLYCYNEQKPLLEFCAQHGILIQAYNILTPLTQDARGPLDAPLQAAADARGCTQAQVIFLWLFAKGVVALTSSSKKERMAEYVAAADLPPLTEEEIKTLEEIGAQGPAKNINETMCSTCAGYNCTYCTKMAGVPADVKANDEAARAALKALS